MVILGSIVIRNANRASDPARTCLTTSDLILAARTCLILSDIILAARGNAGHHYPRILQAILLHQRIKNGGILRRDTHAAMRGGSAKILYFEAAVDGMKKMEWGMGALSHCLLYQISFIEVAV